MAGEHFSKRYPREGTHQIAWDASSLTAFKRCPRFYELSIIRGYRVTERSVHLEFGSLIHKAIELYERRRGSDSHDAVLHSVMKDILILAENYNYEHAYKTKFALFRTIVWMLDDKKDETFTTYTLADGSPAVELSFRFMIPHQSGLTGESYYFCGHFDRVVMVQTGQVYIQDHKTTTKTLGPYFFNQYSPDNQMSLYTFAGEVVLEKTVAGVIVNGIQIGKEFTRIANGFIARSATQLTEWYEDTLLTLRQAEQYAAAQYWPQNDTACGMYNGCPFRGVCGSDRIVRDSLLNTHYIVQHWNPLEVRDGEDS